MTYEMALELKNAGFSQKFTQDDLNWFAMNKNSEEIHFPTLPELVEACGEKFRFIKMKGSPRDRKWVAQAKGTNILLENGRQGRTTDFKGEGNSPEESVKNLWLALNKEKNETN